MVAVDVNSWHLVKPSLKDPKPLLVQFHECVKRCRAETFVPVVAS